MTAFDAVLDQALRLPDEERSKLAASLLRSLEPEGDELSPDEWDRVWSAELEKRLREVREGTAKLVDGDEVLAELRDISERP
ncbi:MAG TPA: addiction module protein [Kofleriaceae bacterium]|nr:addiction module protein [Kofleriaceae bacterium]